jgi:SAM-dependent methyltransferase
MILYLKSTYMRMIKMNPFNHDAAQNNGYLYSTNASLSSQLANQRLTDITLQALPVTGKTILDIGCGDGVYTRAIDHYGKPKFTIAGDVAEQAVRIGYKNSAGHPIHYMINSAYDLPFAAKSFEIAILRGVLHHMVHPKQALREALRVAETIWVIEPNGYNPGLKLLEKFSAYHLAHGEKSYAPHQLDQWVEQLNGQITSRRWAGFVPMFCPAWLARLMKTLEPIVEHTPLLRKIGSAVYCFCASDTDK